jgi:transposase
MAQRIPHAQEIKTVVRIGDARRLSISIKTLSNWLRLAREGKLAEVGQHQAAPTDAEMELARMKRELAEVKMERDLLKHFAAYFAKQSQ